MINRLQLKLGGILDYSLADMIIQELEKATQGSTGRVMLDCAGIERTVFESLEYFLDKLRYFNHHHQTTLVLELFDLPAEMSRQCQLLEYQVRERSLIFAA